MHDVRDSIRGWIVECLGNIEEVGAASCIVLVHFDGRGVENQIFDIKSTHAKWNKPEDMADAFFKFANRHASGYTGSQQFKLKCLYGEALAPKRELPFGLSGVLAFGPIPGGGTTEPPTATGAMQQGMRITELIIQGALAQHGRNSEVQDKLIMRLMSYLEVANVENRELWVALKTVLMELQKQTHEQRLKEITAARMAEFQRQVIKLAPSLLNMMAGREVFPLSTADTELIETIAQVATPSDLRMLQAGVMGKPGGENIAALLADRFDQARKRAAEDRANEARLAAGRDSVSYEEAERDAAGMAMKALRGQVLDDLPEGLAARAAIKALSPDKANKANGANGALKAPGANGHANGDAPSAINAGEPALIDGLFDALGDQAEMMLGVLAEKDPVLAQRMRDYHETIKKKG